MHIKCCRPSGAHRLHMLRVHPGKAKTIAGRTNGAQGVLPITHRGLRDSISCSALRRSQGLVESRLVRRERASTHRMFKSRLGIRWASASPASLSVHIQGGRQVRFASRLHISACIYSIRPKSPRCIEDVCKSLVAEDRIDVDTRIWMNLCGILC